MMVWQLLSPAGGAVRDRSGTRLPLLLPIFLALLTIVRSSETEGLEAWKEILASEALFPDTSSLPFRLDRLTAQRTLRRPSPFTTTPRNPPVWKADLRDLTPPTSNAPPPISPTMSPPEVPAGDVAKGQRSFSGRADLLAPFDTCDLSVGSWVPYVAPLRYNTSCSFIIAPWNCIKSGRNDSYTKYRWRPKGCSLTVFDAERFGQLMRNKTIMFVGDSLVQNMLLSLACQLSARYSHKTKIIKLGTRSRLSLYFPQFDVAILFLFVPYLVQSTQVDLPRVPPGSGRIVDLDILSPVWRVYIGYVDVFILGTGHWFGQNSPGQPPRNIYRYQGKALPTTTPDQLAHRAALRTLAVNLAKPNRQPRGSPEFRGLAYFITYPMSHQVTRYLWRGNTCGTSTPLNESFSREIEALTGVADYLASEELVLRSSNIRLLGITHLTSYRPDAHIGLTDCTHWCVPGVPDSWTDILLAKLKLEPSLKRNRR